MPFVNLMKLAEAMKKSSASRYIDAIDISVTRFGNIKVLGVRTGENGRLTLDVVTIDSNYEETVRRGVIEALEHGRLPRIEFSYVIGSRAIPARIVPGMDACDFIKAMVERRVDQPQTMLSFIAEFSIVEELNGYRLVAEGPGGVISIMVFRGNSMIIDTLWESGFRERVPLVVFLRTRPNVVELAKEEDVYDPRKIAVKYRLAGAFPVSEKCSEVVAASQPPEPAEVTTPRAGEAKAEEKLATLVERQMEKILKMAMSDEG